MKHVGAAAQSEYSLQEAASLLGLSTAEVRRCLQAGLLTAPAQGEGEVRLTFQDLVLLRRAASLHDARMPPHRVRRALVRLKAQVAQAPLSGIELSREGRELVARTNDAVWNPETQQLLFDFDARLRDEKPSAALPFRPRAGGAEASADGWYERGLVSEEHDGAGAEDAYRKALRLDPHHVDALINLGRLLHARGALGEAERLFRDAIALKPKASTGWFNLAVTLEDQNRLSEALLLYERALEADAGCEDAHYNAARLYEQLGQHVAALHHLKTYRALLLSKEPR